MIKRYVMVVSVNRTTLFVYGLCTVHNIQSVNTLHSLYMCYCDCYIEAQREEEISLFRKEVRTNLIFNKFLCIMRT